MRALLQRASRACVSSGGQLLGQIGPGLVVFLGVAAEDDSATAEKLAARLLKYRVFADDQGRMNLSLADTGGGLLVVSQFTLCAETQKGLRPGFSTAAPPERAELIYESFVDACRSAGVDVQTGRFGADMQVELVNDGPVTFLLET